MFPIYGMHLDDEENDAEPLPPIKLLAGQAAQIDKMATDTLINSLVILSKASGMGVVQHGARLAVVGELLVSILTHLPAIMRAEIVESFRGRIEDVMSLSDDRSLPEQYHSALLAEVNRYLNVGK